MIHWNGRENSISTGLKSMPHDALNLGGRCCWPDLNHKQTNNNPFNHLKGEIYVYGYGKQKPHQHEEETGTNC